MKNIIILNEKIKDNEILEKEDLITLVQEPDIKDSSEIKKLVEKLQNMKSAKIVGSHQKLDIFHKLLEDENIVISDDGVLTIHLSSLKNDIECDEPDIITIDGLEELIKSSAKLEPLQTYTSHALEGSPCKNSIAISLELFQDGDANGWDDIFDELGSNNPDRDIKEYSNTRELLNRLSLEFKKREKSNYDKLKLLLDAIIQENSSIVDAEKIREKYRNKNNYKQNYQKKRQLLISIANDLSVNLQNEAIDETMQEIVHSLESQEFSIGVTGIIKAGKSTMMNALLGEDILGTAIRPETANLTTIKKEEASKAIVHFWSSSEWQEIKNSALDEQSKEFVQVSESLENFQKYVGDESKSLDINIDDLDNYTSARKSENLCNLVKEVELLLPLEFLDGGVAIVDTPGIDDPIVQREKITLEYLSTCSAILHLMNAKQSATQKDIEFIGDALIDQGISSLLVVITRIDTLGKSKEEIDKKLADIIQHAKTNLEIYLSKRSSEDISSILAKLEFLPLAGKFAMQHRIGEPEKALKKGYELKDTGILEIENYLNSMLFGEKNVRAKLAISNAYRNIEHSTTLYSSELKENYALIGLKKDEIDEKLSLLQSEKVHINLQLDEIINEIGIEEKKIQRGLESLKSTFEIKFDNLRKKLIEEISSYIIDELFKGDKPNEDEIRLHIESKLKEFVSEIQQWYKKQSQLILEDSIDYIDTQYTKLALPENVNIDLKIDKVDVLNDFTYQAMMIGFGGAIGFALGFLLGPLGIVGTLFINWWAGDYIDEKRMKKIESQVKKKMIEVDKKLNEINNDIHESMLSELKKYDKGLILYFNDIATQPAQVLKKDLEEKESILNQLSENAKSQEKSDNELKQAISMQISTIEQNLNQLKEV